MRENGWVPVRAEQQSVLDTVRNIMNKVQLFQDRILTDAKRPALASGAAAYRWEDLANAPVNPVLLLQPRRYGDDAKVPGGARNTPGSV
jgi:hypothetical protein